MKELIERFYKSVAEGGSVPIPYREIILTARIMDEIFAQICPAAREREIGPSLNSTGDNRGQICQQADVRQWRTR